VIVSLFWGYTLLTAAGKQTILLTTVFCKLVSINTHDYICRITARVVFFCYRRSKIYLRRQPVDFPKARSIISHHKMRGSLLISPAPFKSSFLSIPPSPFSPRTPFTPTIPFQHPTQKGSQQSSKTGPKSTVNVPSSPLPWTWTCHQCHLSYRLSVTRRCLQDGHYYCSGTTTIKAWRTSTQSRRTRKHGACNSEFDYSGWKSWSRWRRDGPRNKATLCTSSPVGDEGGDVGKNKKDCWNMCDYPSECKWGKKFGIHTPVETCAPVREVGTMSTLHSPIYTTLKGNTKTGDHNDIKTPRKEGKLSFWTALLASVEKRKISSGRVSSPLSAVTEGETERERKSQSIAPPQDSNDKIIVTATELSVLGDSSDSSLSDSSDSTVEGPRKPLLSRRRYRRGTSARSRSTSEANRAKGIPASELDTYGDSCNSKILEEGSEPLRRIQSRYSGYQSCCV
jgi:hypothetical protein